VPRGGRPDPEEVQRSQDRDRAPQQRGDGARWHTSEEDRTGTHRHAARERLRAQEHQRRNATLCHLAGMDLARYYRGGLVDVPLYRLLALGRWAA
jgi:hypothetical protein